MADFSAADLRGARFERADLTRARFFDIDLRDAWFRGADMSGVTMRGVEMVDVDIYPVRECLLIVLNEEWHHRQFAERDLAVLEARR